MNDQDQLLAVIAALRDEVRTLGERVCDLETRLAALPPAPPAVTRQRTATAITESTISEEELLALSAAIAAFLGVRARIRQVRLVHSATWAQVGRVHIQASHRVH